jgi:WD40 repeat protein
MQLQIWNSSLFNIANMSTTNTNVVTSLTFNPNLSLLASSSADQSIIIWNVASFTSNKIANMKHCSYLNEQCYVATFSLLPNGSIISGPFDNSTNLFIWDQTTLIWCKF